MVNKHKQMVVTRILTRPKLCGALLVLLTNCCYISNSYLVKWIHLGPGEISLVRGILQIIGFSSIIVRHKLTGGHIQINTRGIRDDR